MEFQQSLSWKNQKKFQKQSLSRLLIKFPTICLQMTKNFTNIAYEFGDIVFVKIKVLALLFRQHNV